MTRNVLQGERGAVERRVRELLAVVYTPDGVEIWLNARNRNLGGLSPRNLLIIGGDPAARVLDAAERLADAP